MNLTNTKQWNWSKAILCYKFGRCTDTSLSLDWEFLVMIFYRWPEWPVVDFTFLTCFLPFQNETKMVQMMYMKTKYNMGYISEHRTKVLEIPYVDNELSMIILLPDEIEDNSTGLEKVRHYCWNLLPKIVLDRLLM